MKHHGILTLFKLALLGLLICLPLTSCTRVDAKANATSTEATPVRAVPAVSADVPLEIAAVGNVEATDSVESKVARCRTDQPRRLHRRTERDQGAAAV